MALLSAALIAIIATGLWVAWRSRPASDWRVDASPGALPAPSQTLYDVEGTFVRVTRAGEQRLTYGDRLRPGDELVFSYMSSRSTYLYIVNEPDVGQALLMFPLPGSEPANPLPANARITLPGAYRWQVTSAGGREHFIVFASPQPVGAFDQSFARLAAPRVGEPIRNVPLPAGTTERLRGVGGLVPADARRNESRLTALFTVPLRGRETADGLWVRQLTLENPR
jgi:hypothetical protein